MGGYKSMMITEDIWSRLTILKHEYKCRSFDELFRILLLMEKARKHAGKAKTV